MNELSQLISGLLSENNGTISYAELHAQVEYLDRRILPATLREMQRNGELHQVVGRKAEGGAYHNIVAGQRTEGA